jgi:preprotein translocase subunit SecG
LVFGEVESTLQEHAHQVDSASGQLSLIVGLKVGGANALAKSTAVAAVYFLIIGHISKLA